VEAAKLLVKEGFTVLPYCHRRSDHRKKLATWAARGDALAAPIGSVSASRNPYNLRLSRKIRRCRVIVDAGVAPPADAAIAMELGCHGILMNTAVAAAKNPIFDGRSHARAVSAGRQGIFGGPLPNGFYATLRAQKPGSIE